MRKEQNMTQWHKYSAETEGERENFVLISQDGDLQLLVPEAQHIVRVSILYFFITLCNPIPRSLPNVTDTNDPPPLSRALNIHGHRDPGVFHLFTSDHHNSYPWRQMKLQRARLLRLLLVRSPDRGLWLVRTEALPPDLTLHDSPDVIINYWRCAVQVYTTLTLTPWPFDWPIVRPGIPGTGLMQQQLNGQSTNQRAAFTVSSQSEEGRFAIHTR